jgi:hypothetical protein
MAVPSRVIFTFLLIFSGFFPGLRAQDLQPFTFDLPFDANEATPVWLGHPVTPAGTFATLDLPITPPGTGAALLVTVFFQEKNGGFLRIGWQADGAPAGNAGEVPGPGEVPTSSVLCDNFYEGIGMSNQRSLLVPAEAMKGSGTLVFQCGDSTLGISRIRMEWLQSSTGLSSPAITDLLVTPAAGKPRLPADLAGQPATAQDPAWQGRIVNVPVTDLPLRIEQGVDFTVQMDGAPTQARLALKESGLPWGQHLVVWLNNHRAGIMQAVVPELGDAGYPADQGATYVGWRDATFYVPAGLLTAGNDTLQFSAEPDVPPATPADPSAAPVPLAVKDVLVQFNYPVNSAATANAASAPGSTNSGVVPPVPTTNAPAADAPLTASISTPDDAAPASPDMTSVPVPNVRNPALLSLPADLSPASNP